MIRSIFHVNINVTNFDRSLEFYKMVGFKVVLDLGEGPNQGNDKGLNVPDSRARAALLALSGSSRLSEPESVGERTRSRGVRGFEAVHNVAM
jgi:catechol 2,3-dioxygenase-like lactoylglutathione lyase family enzyme